MLDKKLRAQGSRPRAQGKDIISDADARYWINTGYWLLDA
jgi:hypothetical protein